MGYSSSYSVKIICFFLFILVGATSSQNTKCPFQYLYHFGDGVTDVGNSVRVLPWGPSLPAAPADFGFPQITPYLSRNATSSNGVIFSVARSPVLHHNFFRSRGIKIPPYVVPLSTQLSWFKTYLKSVCSTPTDCANRLGNSLILLGDIEANDIGYALTQGKSIKEVQTYVHYTTRAQINAARELIKMGAKLLVIPGSAPIGCFPYMLTALPNDDPTAYDDLGCLKSVNDLIRLKNNDLQQAMNNLSREFPNVSLLYGPFDEGVLSVLAESSTPGPNGNMALKSCCGIGGKYNYDSKRFCGSPGVPVCPNPDQYIFWDGLHFTQEASARIEKILIQPTLSTLNCTSQLSVFM
ncbi:hypothetical protein Pfo_007105 [Paulownia fortunei]|nr:hypothetical protein Pfo_007105 [Paulownia fortunei]